MPNRMDDGDKISVRVGKARVVKRKSGSMDMFSEKGTDVEENTPEEPVKEKNKVKKSWFQKKDRKEKPSADKEPMVKAEWVDKAIRVLLHIAIIGIPLLFLPFTFEAFELNKQTLLYGVAIIAVLLWLIKIIIEKRVTLAKTLVTVPILIFLAVDLIATLLSTDMLSSFFGFYGRFSGGFLQFAALAILFFVAINTTKSLKRVTEYLYSFIFAYLVIVVIGFLQIFGAYLFPWDFTKIGSFSPLGASLTTLSIFLAAGLGVVVTVMLKGEGWKRSATAVVAIAGLVLMFLMDVSVGWIALIAAMVVIFAVVVMRAGQFKGSRTASWLPLIFLAVAVALILIPAGNLFTLDIPTEISLGRPVSWDISKATLSDSPILGSGPETFFHDFNAHRPVQFNNSIIWSMRFDKAGTQFLQDLSTVGILGVLALGAIVVTVIWEVMKTLVATKEKDDWLVVLAPFATWIALIVASFFYFLNTTLFFTSWIMMALTIAGVIYMRQRAGETREHKWSFASSPQAALITSFIFLIVLIGGIVSFYYIGKFYVADMHYRNSQEKLITEDFSGAADEAVAAARLNGNRSVYHRGAAQAFMALANQEAIKEEPDVNIVSNNVGLAIDAGRTAANIEQNNVVNHEFLGGIYQNAGLYVQGADQWVIDAYNKAIELDPNNPVLWNNLGKAYVIKSDRILLAAAQEQAAAAEGEGATAQPQIPQEKRAEAEEALNTAVEKFQKAIELKQEYFDAHLSLAQTYDKKGDRDQAIEEMQIAVQLAPQNPDAHYELGRVYYNNEQYDEAEIQFEEALRLFENHSNSLYSLGLIYLQRDDKNKALEMFKKVLELNPENADVQEKIDILEGRKTPEAEEVIEADVEVEEPEEGPAGEEFETGVDVEEAVESAEEETDED